MENENLGCLHVICGSGKGKTSAAMGMALRAAGAGLRVHIAQFLKDGTSGEISALKRPGVTTAAVSGHYGFTWQLTESERQQLTREHNALLSGALSEVVDLKAVLLAALLLVLTNFVRPTRDLHPALFIAFSAIVGILFNFAGL